MGCVACMKFILDSMLGNLSRWLRMLGCTVKYFKKASNHELLDLARDEDHILLTRNLTLFRRAKSTGISVFFIEGMTILEMLANFSQKFKIPLVINISISRCPICDSHIKRIKKTDIADKVPSGTLKHHDEFWLCTGCSKVYWQGSHWKNINATLQKAKKRLESRIKNTSR